MARTVTNRPCDHCGTTYPARPHVLRKGVGRWCSHACAMAARQTHGLSGTTEHGIWKGIRKRCLNKSTKAYPRYGGRGIRICRGWADSFASFLADMGPRVSAAVSVDRIENDGHYSC